ncbi:MAG: flagellin [Planctomycetota bacterium]|nr:flagellin [Planctomycetota bacterium]
MSISVHTSRAQLFSARAFNDATREKTKTMERLATGKQINRASDDPAGTVAVESLKASEKSLTAERSSLDQNRKFLGAREGGLSAIGELLNDLKGVVTILANKGGVGEDERRAYELEGESILKAINHATATTIFGGTQIIADVDANQIGRITRSTSNADGTTTAASYALADLVGNGGISLAKGDLEGAAESVDKAISDISSYRAAVGAYDRQIQSHVSVINAKLENIAGARSQIEDADFAKETSNLIRNQVLEEAAAEMEKLAGRQNAKTALELLRSAAGSAKNALDAI